MFSTYDDKDFVAPHELRSEIPYKEEEGRAKVEKTCLSEENEMFGFNSFEYLNTCTPMEDIRLSIQSKKFEHSFNIEKSSCCSSDSGNKYDHSSNIHVFPHKKEIESRHSEGSNGL